MLVPHSDVPEGPQPMEGKLISVFFFGINVMLVVGELRNLIVLYRLNFGGLSFLLNSCNAFVLEELSESVCETETSRIYWFWRAQFYFEFTYL